MAYVIYLKQEDANDYTPVLKVYKTKRGLADAARKFEARYGARVAVTTKEDFDTNVVKEITRNNLIGGGEFKLRSDTPSYCDPSCESYHSM